MKPDAIKLEPPQELAAHTLDRHVSVTAGPGAGKTLVLVERYLEILRRTDTSVDQIAAITFTNRAANEMRERVRRRLDDLLRVAAPDQRARWMRHKRTLDGAVITTIHGFCARLLREFPVEARVDPQFALLDEHEAAMLHESVVEEVVTLFINSGHEAITRLAAGFGREQLVGALLEIHRGVKNLGLELAEVERQTAGCHATSEQYSSALETLDRKMSEFLGLQKLTSAAAKKQRMAAEQWPLLRTMIASIPPDEGLAEYCKAIEEFRECRPVASGALKPYIEAIDKLIWEKNLDSSVPGTCFDLHARDYAMEMLRALKSVEERLEAEKQRLSALDFDDLQLKALRLLEERPEALKRATGRYRYFLVDEFQDTNALQRRLMERLALASGARSNLFIVGDRKQSIYGFRGADVDVFREMTDTLVAAGGVSVPLALNFRSQPELVGFVNSLFENLFKPDATVEDLEMLGYVEHEDGEARREMADAPPLVEVLLDVADEREDDAGDYGTRERDARQIAARIRELVDGPQVAEVNPDPVRSFNFGDIALLFRAMTEVSVYETIFRSEGIPYLTVQGKGFYGREEVRDLIQLLRFLDNKTDELALAAVLRSPLFGVSDDGLLALRLGPDGTELRGGARLSGKKFPPLLRSLQRFDRSESIPARDREALASARDLLAEWISLKTRVGLGELLRKTVVDSEYRTVIAATFDGTQRLANVDKLFALAERFERGGGRVVRDFVRFVHDFEEIGGRESEGFIDESLDAVRLMTIHQAKGLEFPVVIVPEMQRQPAARNEWYVLDRHRGLTVKVPDGRGGRVAGCAMETLMGRATLRETFEATRLLYVAATRARDRLILSGATENLRKGTWLHEVAVALGIDEGFESRELRVGQASVRLTVNLSDVERVTTTPDADVETMRVPFDGELEAGFPLMKPVEAERFSALHRFSVTQLLNYERCARQYYFDRVLNAPAGDEITVLNAVEAPEPTANLTATLKGAVIHRFCETFQADKSVEEGLLECIGHVIRRRSNVDARLVEIDRGKAVEDLLPLARNYLSSGVKQRVDRVALSSESGADGLIGVMSEQRFRLRRPAGILTGTIDKLLLTREGESDRVAAEIVDFKTNRFPRPGARRRQARGQLEFEFLTGERSLAEQAEVEASDYRLQMQAYALAVRRLIPSVGHVRATLHFLDPNVEVGLSDEVLDPVVCEKAIDQAMEHLAVPPSPGRFLPSPAGHCRVCAFLAICEAGREWLAGSPA